MKNFTLLTCLFCNFLLFSQTNFNSDSYNVSLNDIETNVFSADTTANALVIYEEGNSYVDKNEYDLRTELKHKIKILKREGFDKANVAIYLYNNDKRKEQIKNIFAATYNLEAGKIKITKLDAKNIFTEKYNENYTVVKFTLPNIKEGSVITYSYTKTSPFMFNYYGWKFQDDIPKLYSDYRASIPANWDYNIKLVGYKPLDINTSEVEKNCLEGARGASAGCSLMHYAMKDIPAFKEENYMTSKSNYLARIDYELKTFQGFDGVINHYTKTWETVDDELRKEPNIGRQLGKSLKLEDFLDASIISETNALKKAESIYWFVQDNYTWNEEFNIFKDVSIKDIINNKSGNVSAINILLHNLLLEAGIDVKPVLLSTRNSGFATKIFPVISDFNYLIVQATINGKPYLLDATDKYLSFGDLPFRCLNGYGRILDFKKGSEWIDIAANNLSTKLCKVELNLSDSGNITGKVTDQSTGYHALNSKKKYFPNKESYVDQLQNNFPHIEITNHIVDNEDKKSPNFVETYDVTYEDNLIADKIYLNPFLFKFFNENPFKLQERTYPIDFGYKDVYFYSMKLNFGETFSIIEAPKDYVISLPNNSGQLLFTSTIQNNSVIVSLKFNFKETIYGPEFYPYLKEFMNKIVDIQTNSLILLQKKQ